MSILSRCLWRQVRARDRWPISTLLDTSRSSATVDYRLVNITTQRSRTIYTTLFTINGSTKSNNIQQQHIIHTTWQFEKNLIT